MSAVAVSHLDRVRLTGAFLDVQGMSDADLRATCVSAVEDLLTTSLTYRTPAAWTPVMTGTG